MLKDQDWGHVLGVTRFEYLVTKGEDLKGPMTSQILYTAEGFFINKFGLLVKEHFVCTSLFIRQYWGQKKQEQD